jgi:calcineurin-like phosphoesterase family protein
MSNIWFTSDTHFGHRSILTFCPNTRLGIDHNDHDEILIRNWGNTVSEDDTVYMLGDIFFCGATRANEIMDRLPGKKHLIYGNHDEIIKNQKPLRDKFASVNDYLELSIEDRLLVLFHYPLLEWNGIKYGSYCLHGHVHGTHDTHPYITNGRIMDAGIDGRPDGIVMENGPMNLWNYKQIKTILDNRPVRPFYGTHKD